jgi:hypothetical protein
LAARAILDGRMVAGNAMKHIINQATRQQRRPFVGY